MKKLQVLIIAFLVSLSICAFVSMQAKAPAAASKLVFTAGAGQSLTAGVVSPTAIVVQRQDASGNPVSSGTSAITVSLSTSSSGGAFYSNSGGTTVITSITIAAGSNSSAGFYYKDTATGNPTLTGAYSGLTSATTQFTINAGALDHFVFNTISTQTAGSAFSITITAKDSNGNTVTSYTGTNTLTISLGTISPTSTTAFAAGVWTGQVTISQIVTGISISTSGGGKSGTSNSFNVNAVTLDHFVFNTISSPQTAGTAFSITITAKASNGNTVTSYTGTPTLSVSTGTISPTITGAFSSGVWTGMVTVTGAGSGVTLGVNDGSGHTGTSNSFTVTHATAASSVVISPAGSSVTAGASKTYSATASDAYGNTWDVTSSTSWSISSGAGGSWSSNVYTSATAGSWIVTGTYNSAPYTTGLTVNPAGLDHFVFNTIAAQTAGVGFSITVTAKDAYGNSVTGYAGSPSLSYSAGSISPGTMNVFVNGVGSTTVTVTTAGSSVTITATDGSHSGASNSFTVNPTISASAGANGAISPTGIVSVNYGGSQSFTITANAGYHIADVVADNVSLGAVSSYSFTAVQAAHTITASFAINTFIIAASAGSGGSISPAGSVSVNYGDGQAFNITADTGYYIVDVLVNGSSVGAVSSYTFTNVQATNTISATFTLTPTPTPNPTPTSSPSPTATPIHVPTPTPKPTTTPTPPPSPTPTSSSTTVPAKTDSGATVYLAISGNVTSSQMSNVTIATSQSAASTTVSFTVTGEGGTAGFSNVTIPKKAVPYGTAPTIYIDNQPAQDQGFTQDANNYYTWYTTHFSTHQVAIQFPVSPPPAVSSELVLAFAINVGAIILISIVVIKRSKDHGDLTDLS
jgi:hypothetical protein